MHMQARLHYAAGAFTTISMVYDGKGWAMKLALAQIDMRLGDIEGICGRIEDRLVWPTSAGRACCAFRLRSLWAPCPVAWWALPTLSTTCLPA